MKPSSPPPIWPTARQDHCPGGDYTGNRYDGSCGSMPKRAPRAALTTCRYTSIGPTGYMLVEMIVFDTDRVGYTPVMQVDNGTPFRFKPTSGLREFSHLFLGNSPSSKCRVWVE